MNFVSKISGIQSILLWLKISLLVTKCKKKNNKKINKVSEKLIGKFTGKTVKCVKGVQEVTAFVVDSWN